MDSVREAISRAVEMLRSREEARDEALGRARRARVLSKQAILHLHNLEPGEAEGKLVDAGRLLGEMGIHVAGHPEMEFYEAVEAARQEYAEAQILYGLNTGAGYPSPAGLGVPETDYIMGLADVPGELRRQTLDHLRAGDLERAEANMAEMENIYMSLVEAEEASLLLKGLRRKLDVARTVNERTRAEITSESSRARLTRELRKLGEKLG
jgi:translin